MSKEMAKVTILKGALEALGCTKKSAKSITREVRLHPVVSVSLEIYLRAIGIEPRTFTESGIRG